MGEHFNLTASWPPGSLMNGLLLMIGVARCLSFRSYPRMAGLGRRYSVGNHMPTFDTSHPQLLVLNEDPPVYEIRSFLSDSMCDDIIQTAEMFGDRVDVSRTFLLQKPSSSPTQTDDTSIANSASLSHATRNSTTWYLENSRVAELLSRISALTGQSISTFEEPQVVRYKPGQRYAWHQDAIPKGKANAHAGNRLATAIVYLNDLPVCADGAADGSPDSKLSGYTSFRDFKLDIRPEKGKCVVFFPCFADGTPDHRTAHCSHAVVGEGVEKWIAQVWVHERPYLY